MHHLPRAAAVAAMAVMATTLAAGTAAAESATPQQNPAPAAAAPSAPPAATDPVTAYTQAFVAVSGAFANDSTLGRVIGTGAGMVIGCPLGALTGGSLATVASLGTLTPIGIVGGCIIGAAGLGFVGGTVGSIISGSPAIATAMQQQYTQLHAEGFIAAPVPSQATGR